MADPRPLLDSYPLHIDGRWVDPQSGRYDDISAATDATIAQAPDAGLADVDGAIDAARRAFDSGSWAGAAPEERARFGPVLTVLRYSPTTRRSQSRTTLSTACLARCGVPTAIAPSASPAGCVPDRSP